MLDRVLPLVVAAARSLVIGDPDSRDTVVGPLISAAARDRVAGVVGRAVAGGAALLTGGAVPDVGGPGAYYEPTVLLCDDRHAAVVQEETFGPVLVVQPAADLDDAIALANGVRQGLLMAVCTRDPAARSAVMARAAAGIVQIGSRPPAIHPDAPFGGWKASGLGPPEHGVWDVEFLTRAQAVYGMTCI